MGKVIAIANAKGGVGKTTTTAAIASLLSNRGYRVIAADTDPQSDLSIGFNIDPQERNIFDCLFNFKKIKAVKVNENLVLVGGSLNMKPALFEKAAAEDKEYKLSPYGIIKKRLKEVVDEADFILIDCPPNIDTIVMNALAASDYVLIPTEAHRYSINGIVEILDLVEALQSELNPQLQVLGILVTRFRSNTVIHSQLFDDLKESYPDYLFEKPIKENITLQEVSHEGQELVAYNLERQKEQLIKSRFSGMENYEAAVEELLTRINHE